MRLRIPNDLSIGSSITFLTLIIGYLAGIALAIGFWSTTFSIFFPPYSLYLTVAKILEINKWLT